MNIVTFPIRPLNPHASPKTVISLGINITKFIEDHGLERCGLLTLVFGRHVSWKQADVNLRKAQRALIEPRFRAWICVVERHKDGRPHFHFIVACHENIREGFDFDAREQAKEINRHARSQHRRMTSDESALHKSLTQQSMANASALRMLWNEMRSKLPHYGFGRCHPGSLEPVCSSNALRAI